MPVLFFFLACFSWGQDLSFKEDSDLAVLSILSPLPDSTVPGDEPLEVSVILSGAESLSVFLLVDGVDVTDKAEIAGDYVFYLSPKPLPAGNHRIFVIGLLNGDTLLSENWSFVTSLTLPPRLAEPLPWELTVNLGWQFSSCHQDTTGLSLSTPVGHYPSGGVSFNGQLWGVLAQGDLSYDRTYDPHPHGLVQFSRPGLDLSLGEFMPGFSSLAFANALPLGLLGRLGLGLLSLDFTACRTASADTALSSFAQYLYGGRASFCLEDSLQIGLGYLQGYDQPSSLPDSVRYRTTSMIVADTIFGLVDTLIYVDSLQPAENRIGWISARKTAGLFSIDLEAAGTHTVSDDGNRDNGWGYLFKLNRAFPKLDISLTYSSTDNGFRSFGSPYLETAKNELEAILQTDWPGKIRSTWQGSVYKAFADSSPGLGWELGAGWSYRYQRLENFSFNLNYAQRPYQTYLFQNRGVRLGAIISWAGSRFNGAYGYNSSSAPATTQSHNVSFEASRPLYRSLAAASLGYQYYQLLGSSGSSNIVKTTLTASLSGNLTASLNYRLQVRHLTETDRIDSEKSYRQEVVSANLGLNF